MTAPFRGRTHSQDRSWRLGEAGAKVPMATVKVPSIRDRRPCRARGRDRQAQEKGSEQRRGGLIMSTAQRPAPVVVTVDGRGRSMGAVRYAMREAHTRGTVV